MKTMAFTALTTLAMAAVVYGQDNDALQAPTGEPQEAITATTPAPDTPRVVDDSPFRRLEAMLWLARQGFRSEGGFGLPAEAVPANAPLLEADVLRLDLSLRAVEAIGNVVVTTTRGDGSTVTMRADRLRIEEGP